MPLTTLPGLRQLLGRRGDDPSDDRTAPGHDLAVHPESTLESMLAYQAEREPEARLPRQRRGAR